MSPRMEPAGGGTQMLVHKQLSVPQPSLQGQNPAGSTFPTPTNRLCGVCKCLGFPGLVCWVNASPWAGLLCCGSCVPSVSSACGGVCGARRPPLSLALLLPGGGEVPEELAGQPVTRVGDVNGPYVTIQTTNQPFPGKRCSKSLLSSHFPWLAGWVAAALLCCPWDGMALGGQQDGRAWPGYTHPSPQPCLGPGGHCDCSVTAEALTHGAGQLWAQWPDPLLRGAESALRCRLQPNNFLD